MYCIKNEEDKRIQNSKESFLIVPSYIKNKDHYFTKKQIEYYEVNYPFKELEEASKVEFDLKK